MELGGILPLQERQVTLVFPVTQVSPVILDNLVIREYQVFPVIQVYLVIREYQVFPVIQVYLVTLDFLVTPVYLVIVASPVIPASLVTQEQFHR